MTSSPIREQLLTQIDPKRYANHPVGVVYGGVSVEREISLRTGKALAKALRGAGYTDVQEFDLPTQLDLFLANRPDVVLIGLHGGMGEDGTLQGFLTTLGIPYTGSGVMTSSLAMDKARAKSVMAHAGVAVPRGVVLGKEDLAPDAFLDRVYGTLHGSSGVVVKPNNGGSSVGTYLLKDGACLSPEMSKTLSGMLEQQEIDAVLVEECLTGPEYSVGFFGELCLGAIQIQPVGNQFYDFDAKYESDTTQYDVVVDEELGQALESLAKSAWGALGGAGVGRVDVMANGEELLVLEVNTVPGMTATSLVPKLAQRHGISFEEFTGLMVASATTRP